MKNIIKALIITTTFLTIGSMQVFATNVEGANPVANYITSSNSNAKDHAYIEKSKAIREEIKTLNIQELFNLMTLNSTQIKTQIAVIPWEFSVTTLQHQIQNTLSQTTTTETTLAS